MSSTITFKKRPIGVATTDEGLRLTVYRQDELILAEDLRGFRRWLNGTSKLSTEQGQPVVLDCSDCGRILTDLGEVPFLFEHAQ